MWVNLDCLNLQIDILIRPFKTVFHFVGAKTRTKEQLERLMFHKEMEVWIEDAKEEEANHGQCLPGEDSYENVS